MSLEVNRLHHPVTALGPGVRAGIWVQGCSIECSGCIARDTWQAGRHAPTDVTSIVEWVASLPADELSGVTISGGEPFDQPDSLLELLVGLTEWREEEGRAREIDVLCYSGYALRRLKRLHADVLAHIDAVITGPYREDRPTDLIWRGSANQDLVPLTALGHARYASYIESEPSEPPIQISVETDAIHWIGVPRRGDLADLESRLGSVGVKLGAPSWRR
jgi:anaerobic ribonucleoside-triphosphate reductase activating protein